jgi:hypothetical protein
MNRNCLIITTLIFIKSALSQNTLLDYKYALKIYNLSTFEENNKTRRVNNSASYYYNFKSTTLQVLHPTIAFQWKAKKNNFHEMELTSLIVGKLSTKTEILNDSTNSIQTLNGSDLINSAISLRYEYIMNFSKSKVNKLLPSLGFGFNPYFKRNKYFPKVSSIFPTSESYFGIRTFINPRLTYFITSNLFIDINIPICFFDTYYFTDKEDNPSVPANERKIVLFSYNQFPKIFSGRIGFGIRL